VEHSCITNKRGSVEHSCIKNPMLVQEAKSSMDVQGTFMSLERIYSHQQSIPFTVTHVVKRNEEIGTNLEHTLILH
jgi:hypothetical protein